MAVEDLDPTVMLAVGEAPRVKPGHLGNHMNVGEKMSSWSPGLIDIDTAKRPRLTNSIPARNDLTSEPVNIVHGTP